MLWVLFEKRFSSGSYENVAFTTISNFKPSCTRLKESWSELRLLKAFLLIKYKKKTSILLLLCLIQCMTQSIGLFPQLYHQYIWWWFIFFYWFQQIKFNKRKLWFQLDEMRLRWSMADSIYRLIHWYIMGGIKNQCRSYNSAPSAKTSSINLLATKMSQKNFVLSKKYVLALNLKSRLM